MSMICILPWPTIVVWEGQNGRQVSAVLSDDTEAGHGASLAGDVERRVPTVVG